MTQQQTTEKINCLIEAFELSKTYHLQAIDELEERINNLKQLKGELK